MERLHTTAAPGYRTYRCPSCGRQIRTLTDEYGEHNCVCGWEPWGDEDERTLTDDIREYVEMCRSKGYTPDAFAFSTIYQRVHGNVPGREIDEMITKELANIE